MNDMPVRKPISLDVALLAVWAMAKRVDGAKAMPGRGQVATEGVGMAFYQGSSPPCGNFISDQAGEVRKSGVLIDQPFGGDVVVESSLHKSTCAVTKPVVELHGTKIEGLNRSPDAGGHANSQTRKMDGHDRGVGWERGNHQS